MMIKNSKKLMQLFLIFSLLFPHENYAQSQQNIVWEHYVPVASLTVLTGLYVYGLLSPCQDLKNQSQCKYWDKDFVDTMKIYHPDNNSNLITEFFMNDDIQRIANETRTSVIVIHESHVKYNPDNMDLLFEHAELFPRCIIYVKKDEASHSGLSFYDINKFVDDREYFSFDCCSIFIQQLKKLKKNNKSVIVLGSASDHDWTSKYDVRDIGFNIEFDYPSYKERVEFLNLLFLHRSCSNISIETCAKKTIGFSYNNLVELAVKAERYATFRQIGRITNNEMNQACAEIIFNEKIYRITQESFYNTCIHEMGHAVTTAHFDEEFILRCVMSTPQGKADVEITLGSSYSNYYKGKYDQVDVKKKRIMICLAGKVAEHIFFGLSSGKVLNHQNGYIDFMINPGGARSDLSNAKDTAREIYEINGQNQSDLLKELYTETFKLILSYKTVIEKGANLLEQHEFVTGSQVYNLLQNN